MSLIKRFFKCSYCDQCFHSAAELSSHKKRVHVLDHSTCLICRAEIENRDDLITHCRKHLSGNRKCPICGKLFDKPFNVERHFSLEHCQTKKIKCVKCNTTFGRKDHFMDHEKICKNENPELFKCSYCEKRFCKKSNCKRHELNAHKSENENACSTSTVTEPKGFIKGKTFQCKRCGQNFKGCKVYDNHKANCSIQSPNVSHVRNDSAKRKLNDGTESQKKKIRNLRKIKCHKCGILLDDYKQLYRHKLQVHSQQGGQVKQPPWTENQMTAPWENNEETDEYNTKLKDCYKLHKSLILKGDLTTDLKSVFNFPVDNSVNLNDLMKQAQEIYDSQSSSFKINFSVGIILFNVETEEFRYFTPNESDFLLDRPLSISSSSGLDALRRQLSELDFEDFLVGTRPNTKFRPILVTNIRWVVTSTGFPLGSVVNLPDYIVKKKCIWGLTSNPKTGVSYKDNLCIFRCLIAHRTGSRYVKNEEIMHYWREFRQYMCDASDDCETWEHMHPEEFEGIELCNLGDFELCFNVNINVFELLEDDTTLSLYRSRCNFKGADGKKDTMYLNLYKHHLSYIKDIGPYAKKFECSLCHTLFKKYNHCLRHYLTCSNATVHKFPGKFFKMNQSIFDKMSQYGIEIGDSERFFGNFIVFDFEAYLEPISISAGKKLTMTHIHKPISVAVSSNVKDYESPRCFVNANEKELIHEMTEYMKQIQEMSETLNLEKWKCIISQLDDLQEYWTRLSDSDPNRSNKTMCKNVNNLKTDFLKYCKQIPVLGFNSSKYDLNLILPLIVRELIDQKNTTSQTYVIKKNTSYCCFANELFRFLDISHYLAPGFSYSSFLKCFQIEEKKFYFPYEWFDCVEKLDHDELPDYDSFYSELKGANTLQIEYQDYITKGRCGPPPPTGMENYDMLKKVWTEQNMTTFADFLRYYNIMDVGPFVQAIEKLLLFYKQKNIDIFKSAISIPGIARQMLFQSSLENGYHFSLFDEANKDLHQTFSKNIVGGPSLIFLRMQSKNDTLIRGLQPCQKIIGYDCNSLYLSAMTGFMPVGPFIRRKKLTNFFPEKRDSYLDMFYWMDFVSYKNNIRIDHFLNSNREFRIGPYLVDGVSGSNVYEFNGCYYHKHECYLTRGQQKKPQWQKEKEKKHSADKERSEFIQNQGYTIHIMWECEFNDAKQCDIELKDFISKRQCPFYLQHKNEVNENEILEAIVSDRLFGVVECDIQVPADWHVIRPYKTNLKPYDYFKEYCPLFCNVDVPFEAIGVHMQKYVIENDLSQKPRKLLISGLKAAKILLCSELLKWYLNHGLVVTHIYQVVEYGKAKCFAPFTSTVTDARRQGDLNPDSKLLADTYKLLGNSAYGGLLMNKEKHKKVTFVHGKREVLKKTNSPQFRHLDILDEDLFEVQMAKKRIKMDLPIQLGFFILQLAKLRMLEFYYDFMDVFFERKNWEMIMTDTDSAYFGFTSDNLSELVKDDKKSDFDMMMKGFCNLTEVSPESHVLPRECCQVHNKYDQRTPGLFKEEFRGDRLIALASKSYALHCNEKNVTKVSCKGVNKSQLQNVMESFDNVLHTRENHCVQNRGIRSVKNQTFTYKQLKTGFSYLYCKRKVLDDGIHTEPLDIVLNPM